MRRITLLLCLFVFGSILTACASTALPTIEITSTPTFTASPSASPTPEPTFTPEPSPTASPSSTPIPTSTPELNLLQISRQIIAEGGYSVMPILDYEWAQDGPQVVVADMDRSLTISLYGVKDYEGTQTALEIIDEFLGALIRRGFAFEKSDPYAVTVAQVEGIAMDLTATAGGKNFEGQVILIRPSETQYLYGMGLADTDTGKARWNSLGRKVFQALLDSVQFIVNTGAGCVISGDDSYGYSMDNPIKVGGDVWDGPARERAYLDNLRGPDGEAIQYERESSIEHAGTILDIFIVTYPGLQEAIILYLDEYSFSEPMAPVGFTCVGAFPLSQP